MSSSFLIIKWNRFDTGCKMDELFSPARLALQVLYAAHSHDLRNICRKLFKEISTDFKVN